MFIKSIEMENCFDEMLVEHARVSTEQQMNETKVSYKEEQTLRLIFIART